MGGTVRKSPPHPQAYGYLTAGEEGQCFQRSPDHMELFL